MIHKIKNEADFNKFTKKGDGKITIVYFTASWFVIYFLKLLNINYKICV